MQTSGAYLSIKGTQVYYEASGKGDPLLLLHGGFGSTEDFRSQMPELAKHFRVYAFDRPGHGRSPDTNEQFSYSTMTEYTINFIEKLGLGSVNIAGWSDGGIISLLLAISRPDLLKRVVCISANYNTINFLYPGAVDSLKKATPESFRESFVIAKRYDALSPDGPSHFATVFEKTRRMWLNEPNIPVKDLSKIKTPFLVMAGDKDMITHEHTLEIYRAINGAQLCIIPGASHFLLSEKPQSTTGAILDFLL
jgi:pimeloyl-ACP methyl ester carboxylesterase